MVPTSAISGEGISDLLQLMVKLTQTMMGGRLTLLSETQCTARGAGAGLRVIWGEYGGRVGGARAAARALTRGANPKPHIQYLPLMLALRSYHTLVPAQLQSKPPPPPRCWR